MASWRSLTALSTVLAVGLVTAAPTPAVAAVSAFTVSGTAVFHPPPYPEQLVPGFFTGDVVTNIAYPAAIFGMDASVAVAAEGIKRAVENRSGPVVISGFSQGAIAVTYAMRAIMALPADQRPATDELTFLTIGDPTAPGGILRFLDFIVPVIDLTPVAMPDTPYDTVVINGEYDGWGDFPDRPWNLLSVVNALMGTLYVHGYYETIPGGLDLSTADINVTVNSLGGRTTAYLIPTAKLPLVQPLRDIGVPEEFVASIEAPLRAIVDAGYVRHDAAPAPTITSDSAQSVGTSDSAQSVGTSDSAQSVGTSDSAQPVSTAESPRRTAKSAQAREATSAPRPAAAHASRQRGAAPAS